MSEPITSDSAGYKGLSFVGILNAQGGLWTPLAFQNEDEARRHVERFWGKDHAACGLFLSKCRFVPVRSQITVIEEQAS
ncbi:MAG: hypothetical protein JWN66_4951 [Sphingomonas bacterium]|uniref:hypothetical protein n=1 Tax=Sphingomonas bacterium TaxID=1895847 RepID=UPI002608E7E6|nr:hypothetical protein [Sphingomonas bacterium]MDB5707835.1 hypothetical protein [Sphingomonas bacterium]